MKIHFMLFAFLTISFASNNKNTLIEKVILKANSVITNKIHICSICKCDNFKAIECLMQSKKNLTSDILHFNGIDIQLEKLFIDFDFLNVNLKIQHKTFAKMSNIKMLYLNLNKQVNLHEVPDLSASLQIEELTIQNSYLNQIDVDFCETKQKLKKIDFSMNNFESLSFIFDKCNKELNLLDLSYNQLTSLQNLFNKPMNLLYFVIDQNNLEQINQYDLKHLNNLIELSLAKNKLKFIHENAFDSLSRLIKLDLSQNQLYHIPEISLAYQTLKVFKVNDNLHLINFPSEEHFQNVFDLTVPYAYHCCQFYKRNIMNKNRFHSEFIAKDALSNAYEVYTNVINENHVLIATPIENKLFDNNKFEELEFHIAANSDEGNEGKSIIFEFKFNQN
jgi:Leucine-rich repeat (LRR) protein